MRRRLYGEATRKLLPPSPEEDIERLEQLIAGTIDHPARPRRKRPETGKWDEGELNRERVLEKGEQHNVTKQFRRRLYTQILAECPILKAPMEEVQEGGQEGRWKVVFSKSSRGKGLCVGTAEEFEGVVEEEGEEAQFVGRRRAEKLRALV